MPIIASTRSACNEDDTRERYGYTMSPSGLRCIHSFVDATGPRGNGRGSQ